MATTNMMKRRLLLILKMLYEETDENHPYTTNDILEKLEREGISAERKTLRSDLDVLIDAGFDIVFERSSPNRYFWGSRLFDTAELKMLIDAVSSARFITESQSRKLVSKLSSLAGKYQGDTLRRHLYVPNRVKRSNRKIMYYTDAITAAINRGKKITFQYSDFDAEKHHILRNDGETYILSPYALYWNDDYYYVVGWSDKHENISAFRVDRLYAPKVREEMDAVPAPKDFDAGEYSKQIYRMYSGPEVTVELSCLNEMMKYVIDRFGEDVQTEKENEARFKATVRVDLSPTFYGWVFGFGGKIRIDSPVQAKREYREMLIEGL